MAIQLTNITKGIFAKLRRGKSRSSFALMTWLQEKRLKHQEHTNLKTIRFGKLLLRYKRPYEVLHTYKK